MSTLFLDRSESVVDFVGEDKYRLSAEQRARRHRAIIPYSIPRQPRHDSDLDWFTREPSPYRLLMKLNPPRRHVERYQMAQRSKLAKDILLSWGKTEPDPGSEAETRDLMSRVEDVLRRMYGGRVGGRLRFEVDVFGSVSWGGETGSGGDLDLVVIVSSAVF